MQIFKKKNKLLKEISNIKDIAFVPTMGSLHKGHLSLIKKAKKESKNILVSIYINPKQFNSSSDYQKYPKNINVDIALLEKIKIKYLYLPTYKDIYSFKPKKNIYLDKFSKKLCGKFRPNHFHGVVNVINRFIEIINPKSIFLGFKDFQQLTLIRFHFNKNKIPTRIVACPTIRQQNGIALSSRNRKLKKKQLIIAKNIYMYLKDNKNKIITEHLKKNKSEFIQNIMLFGASKIDYLECLNLKNLDDLKVRKNNSNIFIAYYLGNVRIVDNL